MTRDLVAALRQSLGAPHVLTEAVATESFYEDWRGRYRGEALAVALPASTDEVAQVVSLCAGHGVSVVPQGGNTGLCGGATPRAEDGSVVVNLRRLNRVRRVDALDHTLIAEAGCTLAQIQAAAEAVDCLFPLSLASEGSCQIGGNVGTNAGGVHVLRYGTMRQLVMGLEVVLPDGRIWNGLRRLVKDNTGYDLKQLFIGAEGTLGVVTAASLRLFPRPAKRAVAWVRIADVGAALRLLDALRRRFGERVSAFELIGVEALEVVLRHIPGARCPTAETGAWAVLLEVADVDPDAPLTEMLEAVLMAQIETGSVVDVVIANSGAQEQTLWALRENISEAQRIEGFSIKHDISVPVSAIPAFVEAAGQAVLAAAPGARIVVFGHVGDGNLHYNLSSRDAAGNRELLERTRELNRIVHDVVDRFEGSISAEHGLGQLKRDEITRYKGAIELEMMGRIKHAVDPRGLMNPGKVLPDFDV
ncbi:FAD-binding oxidoreductase [Nitrogeniibacter mangrovi]|uniref:FAD-binding oxidoreductase n=1 Tax=Nitrogeniibacter mangrovi TaxID=2016596 RepID=A0A6C1B6Z9_9RHOO|nr:FAD-binding oxidoreductase [Nitrogeniibacter mangrovi]QID18070.1 FAD-binding oxidoreductase [Nitrogeniibacter mangrovi]